MLKIVIRNMVKIILKKQYENQNENCREQRDEDSLKTSDPYTSRFGTEGVIKIFFGKGRLTDSLT